MKWLYKQCIFSSLQIFTFLVFLAKCVLKKLQKDEKLRSRICPEVFIQKLSCISSSGDFQNKDQSDNLGIISSIYICQIRYRNMQHGQIYRLSGKIVNVLTKIFLPELFDTAVEPSVPRWVVNSRAYHGMTKAELGKS